MDPELRAQLEALRAQLDTPQVETPAPVQEQEPAEPSAVGPNVVEGPQPQEDPYLTDPKPVDDAQKKQLEQLRADTVAADIEDGTIKVNLNKNWTAEDYLRNFLAGFNQQIKNGMAYTGELADEIEGYLGGETHKGASVKAADELFNATGIRSEPVPNTITGEAGASTATGLATLATIMAAAPYATATKGGNAVKEASKAVARVIRDHPWLASVTEITSAFGGSTASHVSGGDPTATMVGSMAGGIGGDMAVRTAAKAGRGVMAVGKGAYNLATKGTVAPLPGEEPLRHPKTDPKWATAFTEDQVNGEKLRMEMALRYAIDRIPTTGDPAMVQSKTRALIERADRIGRRIEGMFWDRVPKDERVPVTGLMDNVAKMERELVDTPSVAPTELMQKVKEVYSPIADNSGEMVPGLPTVKRLRDLRGEIRRARMTEQGKSRMGVAVNDGMVANLNRLEGYIDQAISDALPGDVSLKQARAMSIKYHDLFDRGNIGNLLAQRQRGDQVVPPGQTMEYLTGQFQGVDDLARIPKTLGNVKRLPGQPDAYPTVARPSEKAELQQLTTEAENSIRSMFRDTVEKAGDDIGSQARAGIKFVDKYEPTIKHLAKVHGQLEQTGNVLRETVQAQKDLEKSAAARFIKADVQKAVQSIWVSKNPVADVKDLMAVVSKDADALQGFRAAIVDELVTRSKGDPVAMKQILNTPRFRDVVLETLAPDQVNRLDRIVAIAHGLAVGDEKLLRSWFKGPTKILARIIGAQVGRSLAHYTGGGNVQTPGIVSQALGRATEKAFRTTEPKDMLVNAILDPKWERLLLSREPTTTKEARALNQHMRRFISVQEGARQAMFNKMDKEQQAEDDQYSQIGNPNDPYNKRNPNNISIPETGGGRGIGASPGATGSGKITAPNFGYDAAKQKIENILYGYQTNRVNTVQAKREIEALGWKWGKIGDKRGFEVIDPSGQSHYIQP